MYLGVSPPDADRGSALVATAQTFGCGNDRHFCELRTGVQLELIMVDKADNGE